MPSPLPVLTPPETAVRLEAHCPYCREHMVQEETILGCFECGWSTDDRFNCREHWSRGVHRMAGLMIVTPVGGWIRTYPGDPGYPGD